MGRWEPDAAGRLRDAALALFDERGFETTTVAEIAERAGLNRRTFFHHFADKRDVVFAGQSDVAGLAEAIAAQPAATDPLGAAVAGLQVWGRQFEGLGDVAVVVGRIIDASPELQERELTKRGELAREISRALVARGSDEAVAAVASWAAVAVFFEARNRWNRPSNRRSLAALMGSVLRRYAAASG